jgi:uncharacterized tellurite resistance protein B-like protein
VYINVREIVRKKRVTILRLGDREQMRLRQFVRDGNCGEAIPTALPKIGTDDVWTDQELDLDSRLIDEAVEIDRTAIDLYHCTRRLNKILDDQGRRYVVKMMWEIVCADGNVNALEDNIIWRAADLLGVSSRQRVELRRQVSADMVVFACGNIAR